MSFHSKTTRDETNPGRVSRSGRPKFLRALGLVALASVLASGLTAAAARRPNLILVMTDDQGHGDGGFAGTGEGPAAFGPVRRPVTARLQTHPRTPPRCGIRPSDACSSDNCRAESPG